MQWSFFIATFCVYLEVFSQSQTCEYNDSGFRTITCYGISTSYFFKVGLYTSKYHYRLLKCKDCNMGAMTAYLFNIRDSDNTSSSFLSLDFAESNVTSLELHSFSGQDDLRKLQLRKNYIPKLLPGTFYELTELEHLDLSYNKLEVLEERTFKGLVHLIGLNLEGNAVNNIEKLAFEDLENLQYLNLNYNLLKALNADMFTGMVSLETLSLDYNKINVIGGNTFDNFTYLEHLSLKRNRINRFQRDLVIYNRKLKRLNLSFNPISEQTFTNITSDSLEELWIENCTITRMIPQIFRNIASVRNLNMAKNHIDVFNINEYSSASNLQTLNLSENQIDRVNLSIGKSRSLQNLDLSFNNITNFEYKDLYKATPNIIYINFKTNPFSCNLTKELEEFFRFDNIKIDMEQFYCHNNSSDSTIKVGNKMINLSETKCESNNARWFMLFILLFILIVLAVVVLYYLYRTNINIINVGNIVNNSSVPLLQID